MSELSERIGKLKIFVKSSKFKEIDKAQQPLLKKQLKVMLTYEDILKKRLIKYNTAKVFITNVEKVSFQIGVDVLGFPIYHEHIFIDAVEKEDTTAMKVKNMSRHVAKYHNVMYFIHNQVKQN
ncbi:hypothetical protein RCZ01_21970 [Capnocytophaga felis]|uniref:Uncharacterized protein n=1 Tax=Capnocytophaga felis TaxID=2267611 RepID=A0A5M4BCB1_9FLAO|nr:hypothetical protein [Capnocytophaga felis]GET46895.1 hypothetical protein RCZ01_21970 [Capnocytophaga felis]GET48597.1 hypothetical protein RCZ02_14280 [Capnocytophaga felis]